MLFRMGARKLVAITGLTHVAIHGANRLVCEVDRKRLLRAVSESTPRVTHRARVFEIVRRAAVGCTHNLGRFDDIDFQSPGIPAVVV